MRYVLSPAGRAALRRLLAARVLLAFDFDGTLAPIVADPDRAAMRATTRALLAQLAARYPCVVISGRARADARRRLCGVPLADVIGNHGIEPWRGLASSRHAVRRWRPQVDRGLAGVAHVMVEDKGHSIAIHYRRAPDKKATRAAIAAAVAALRNVRLVPGKQVVNLLPRGAPDKGIALESARIRLGCDSAIYVGDDDTDEDAFALGGPGHVLGIRIRRKKGSRASCYLRSQREIDQLLVLLLRLSVRSPTSSGHPAARPRVP
jgi:trehalose 6-phosphate phosphatase